ncbi:GDSL-type esterase/lipase family protein [Mucilaginibacter sp. SMC90]|uniref:GDSL-type esterase/lipase family protein n=1 Tax=Mucilaginibacter sp. SMC90 TaxID=2929803 RepID=UPI001FB2A8FB|nr:GDSL-type esterase/lipase family protein [Mucilaginibacter sp. SMC90]UOE51544.1 GDSL-type esterase/lipase family protein [Mucilaginibacter sp. SMC90]
MIWYEEDVKQLEIKRTKLNYVPRVIFYGSSSIRLWNTLDADFDDMQPVNLGFGGSTLAACVWFFERILHSYNPEAIVVYAGDNDLGDGRNPEEVFIFFKQLTVEVERLFGNIPCYYISLKPSLARWPIVDKYRYTNSLIENEIIHRHKNWQFVNIFNQMIDASGKPIREYYDKDGLHLSSAGYTLWKNAVLQRMPQSIKLA